MLQRALLALALAGGTIALPNAAAAVAGERRSEVLQIRQIAPRQGPPTGCIPPANVISLFENAPSPPADLSITDACAQPTFTGSQSAEYASYTSVVSSWYAQNGPVLASFESNFSKNCPFAAESGGPFSHPALPGVCTAAATGARNGSSTVQPASSSTSSSSGTALATGSGSGNSSNGSTTGWGSAANGGSNADSSNKAATGSGITAADKVAIGFSVPIGVLLIAAAAFFYGRRSRRQRPDRTITYVEQPVKYAEKVELDSAPKVELPGNHLEGLAELPEAGMQSPVEAR